MATPSHADAGVTTGALARRLGVSPTTLRSWDRRYGVGPARREDGRHRRWTPRDVARVETMCRLTSAGVPTAEAARVAKRAPAADAAPGRTADAPTPAAQAPGPAPASHARQEGKGLARAAVRLDATAVEERLAAALADHGLVDAWQDVMVPALHAVGRRWASSGDQYIEVEHMLSWYVSTALRRHTLPTVPPGDATAAGPVLLACTPGEHHTLPLEALNAGLTQLRLPTRMFGGAVPAEALMAAVRRLGPVAVVLWSQVRSTASRPLAEYIAAAEWGVKGARGAPLVVLGGPGWAGRPTRGMLRPTGLRDALDVLAGLRRTPPPGEPRRPGARVSPSRAPA
ncbi:MerR family transcriptional regulator [Streptomyces sp. V3I7]|uniref:MerR family transcriptional regulator n=1 Tax=Streptomyces sp. V3I7 TaxID=3042278 RepID=UPI00277F826A|nr:MerR family transcriptional regulator [Streptomyces sp. V3I7]MDQ0989052.1 DNA-binding transcriptional MerR regulator [Streptomyces sp. V3I7]